MSASEPPGDPNDRNPDDTSGVPLGPEPEPTGAGGAGAGGWGGSPRIEPFAIAALVWAIVSIVLPLVGTIVAFVLAAKAADLIRRSRGERAGMQYVTAARIIAGVVLALWIIGGIAFLALRDDGSSSDNVAIPTQPPSTSVPLTTTSSVPLTTTTTHPPATTTTAPPPPTISVVPPPPTEAPTTAPPTAPPTTVVPPPPTTVAPPPTTKPPVTTSTTSPQQAAAKVQAKLLQKVGVSNRGVPDDERFIVTYTPGEALVVTWAIDNGSAGDHPTGTPDCASPPTSSTAPTSSTSTTTTSSTVPLPTSSTKPGQRTTPEESRFEAKEILQSIKPQLTSLKLDVTGVQLIGTYPIEGAGEDAVVQVLYAKSTVQGTLPAYKKMFDVPPAEVLQCLNPAFDALGLALPQQVADLAEEDDLVALVLGDFLARALARASASPRTP